MHLHYEKLWMVPEELLFFTIHLLRYLVWGNTLHATDWSVGTTRVISSAQYDIKLFSSTSSTVFYFKATYMSTVSA